MIDRNGEITHRQRYGQFFTPKKLVKECISLIKNKGRLLEPSCGAGAFKELKNNESVFIEKDKTVVHDNDVLIMDFFDYGTEEKFDTIIGNPPYVDNSLFKKPKNTRIKVQANLYIYFIEKCFHHLKAHGELIFIVPREFIKQTSAKDVNELLFKNGTITHYYDYGDEKFFEDACPNICIFRYEKDNFSRKTTTLDGELISVINNGIISFVGEGVSNRIGDFFDIKVGAVSGADAFFVSEKGEEFVCSKTRKTGELRKLIYQQYSPELEKYKETLISRKIKKFDETNWFMWGRPVNFEERRERIYVNCRTRLNNPFFLNKCKKWDGSILALFPKENINLENAVSRLNEVDWQKLGFMTGGRYMFSQKSLQEAPIDGTLFR